MVISRGAGLEDLIRVIYPNISSLTLPNQYFSECIILAPCNADVHSINEHILGKYPGEEKIYSIILLILQRMKRVLTIQSLFQWSISILLMLQVSHCPS